MRLNFGQAKQTFKQWINNGTCDLDLAGVVLNQVCERLYESGKFLGMVQRLSICHSSNCVTLPYNVESILEISGKCGQPINLNSAWYEFLPGGPWQLSKCNRICDQAVPRNQACTAFDICPGKTFRVYANLPEDAEAKILIQGFDSDGNRVRTLVGGEYVDGEYIALNNAAPQLSTFNWSAITTVQKPITNGVIQIYQVDPSTPSTNQGLIAEYQPSEMNPLYQRFHISGFCASATHPQRITMLVKMKFVPMILDTDIFSIMSFDAVMFACQALYFWGVEQYEKAQLLDAKAIQALDRELKEALGGQKNVPRIKYAGVGNRALSFQPR